MKSYNGLYEDMLIKENVIQSIKDAAKRKPKISEAEAKRIDTIYRHSKRRRRLIYARKITQTIKNAETEADKFIELVRTDEIEISTHEEKIINENNGMKPRNITRPNFKYEQILHHCIARELKPIVLRSIYDFAYGSIPKRGTHSGKRVLERWIKEYHGKKFYVGQGDVKKCYDSIDLDILENMLSAMIRDKKFLHINKRNLDSCQKIVSDKFGENRRVGIAKGYYTSGWYLQIYLRKFDNFILQELKPDRYMRYADDFILLHRNKKELHAMMKAIREFMARELHLTMKETWQVYRFEYPIKGAFDKNGKQKTRGRFIDFMGFQFHYNRTTIRKRNISGTRRKAYRISKKDKVTWYDASGMLSRLGLFRHADAHGYFVKYIKPRVNIKKMRRTVGNHARKERAKHDRMETDSGDTDGKTA